ncbi:MFS transporter [Bacillus velezensis]
MGIIGVLPQVADRFHISASKAGWLVSIFAFIVAVSGPFLTLLASGINRKVILLLAVLMFAVSNAVYAYTAHFSVMLAFRIIPALCHPVFFSVALAAVARLVPAGQSGKAVTKVFSGITAGFAFGVPFTSYLAERLSLEAAFLFGAIISLIAFTGILLFFAIHAGHRKNVFQKPARHPSQTGFVAQYRRRHLSLCGHVFCLQLFFGVPRTGVPYERHMGQLYADELRSDYDSREFRLRRFVI